MNECTVLGLKEELMNGDIHLIDVREPAEFAGGRVPGAKLIPLGEIEKRHMELDHNKPIYVMCRSGVRGAKAQAKLRELGFQNVINLKGGFEAWKKAGLAYDADDNPPWSIERQVRFTAGLLVFVGVILSLFVHRYFTAIPAFIGFGLALSAIVDWCGMGLLLAKMPWNRRSV